ncbi:MULTISPECIES: hypothetical protein [Streptomyces]|uniref:Uncharacterized protein n=1 Tax=Streptomyces siamensis TaxID=1274986 RepID=A0ABP9IIR8_9ACTN|nr:MULTISPECIES: hypothetical protein [unclassified Streptomyces]
MATEPEGRRNTWTDRVSHIVPWMSLIFLIYKIIEEVLHHV